ncbi:hypothetical protein AN216_10395 [Streptomyces oceani]|uniref:Uncharacterized protein n=2 Tax=Streptomyces oceani TaxID=1075402 RepID=A0A1E7KIB2_9ACTN|nr:hypothetical protein AN216_10395 [Streptomyces oceani]
MVLIHLFLSMVVDDQQMSLAGLEPRSMTVGTVVGGAVFGGYLLLCAGVLLHMAIRDRPPRHFLRIVLISAAVVHGLLGAFSVGLVGWTAFLFMMLVLALLVWSLVAYGERGGTEGRSAPGHGPGGQGPAGHDPAGQGGSGSGGDAAGRPVSVTPKPTGP